MARPEKEFGEHSNDDIIREILREYASREKPIGKTEIIKHVKAMGYVKEKDKSKIERKAIDGFLDRMGARVYETEEECDEIIRECRVTEREIIFIKKGQEEKMIRYITMVSDVEDLSTKKKMNSQRFYSFGNHRGGMSAPKSIGC